MKFHTTCWEITDDGHLREAETAASLQRWQSDNGAFWVVVEGGEPADVTDWLHTLGLGPELVDLFLEPGHAARFLPLNEAIFFEFPILTEENPGGSVSSMFICLDRLVAEVRGAPARRAESSDFPSAQQFATLREPTTSALVCALLVGESAKVRRFALALRTQARRLEGQMEEDPDSITIDEIVALKGSIRDLDEIVDDQLAIFTPLKVVEQPLLDLVRLGDLFQVAITNTESSDRAVDRLNRQARDLQIRYDLIQQEKTNQRLGVLTIISAIFLPLTLMAGIYGMNFDIMPGLHFRYGYPAVLSAMVITAGGLLWYFWSRGWGSES